MKKEARREKREDEKGPLTAKSIIKRFSLNSTTWTFKGFHGVPFTFYYIGLGPLGPCKAYYGDCCKKSLFFVKDDYVRWYWADDDMQRLRKRMIENVNEDPDYLRKMRADWEARLRDFDVLLDKMSEAKLETLSDQELFSLYDKFLDRYMAEFGIVMTVQDAFSMYSTEFLEPRFKKVLGDEFTNVYTTLLAPVEESFVNEERKSRLRIQRTKLDGKDIKELLQEHQQCFFWVRNNYAKQQVLDTAFFEEQLKSDDPAAELERLETEIPRVKKEKEELIKRLKLSQEDSNLIRIAEEFSYLQDERKKYVLIANHHERRFIKEVAKRRGLTEKQVEYSVYPETKGSFDPTQLDLRRKGCVCIQDEKGFYLYEGPAVEEIHKQLFGDKEESVSELSGVTASPGTARGTVRIVLKTHDLIKFQEGDILVSSMTRPEMVVAMEKAAAIVTDEGGVTSHAAVVSRELKIPCIIGTGNATSVLKDGDLVEVDAEKGIVRKVES